MPSKITQITITILAAIMLLLFPLLRGGKTALSALSMEVIGILLLLVIFWSGSHKGKVTRLANLFILISMGVVGVYLIPIPDSIWSSLPGRALFMESVQWLESTGNETVYRSLSLVPINTLAVLLSALPAIAIFYAIGSVSCLYQNILIYTLLFSASFQSVLAILQRYTNNPDLYLGVIGGTTPAGTYLNQNHLTAFVEMAEPLALGLLILALIQPGRSYLKVAKATLFALISLLLTFVPLISSSRTGTVLLLLSIILSFWAMTTPSLRKRVAAPIIALRFVLLLLAIMVQLSVIKGTYNVIARLEPKEVAGDLRWELWQTSWQGIKALFPFGSGPGTFQSAYRPFQPETLHVFVNHLHNDYLELIFEYGIFGILMIASLAMLYIYQWRNIIRLPEGRDKILQSGAGVGMLLFAIFSLTEFNLHTPANAFYFACLAGIFLKQTHKPDTQETLRPPLTQPI